MRRIIVLTFISLIFALSISAPSQAQSFQDYIDKRIEDKIKARAQAKIDQRSNVNQTETPAASDNSTSLVDQSSASDLFGVALNLSGLSSSTTNTNNASSASVTASAYSLYSALKGADPLDPEFYNAHRNWRRLSFTLGYDSIKDMNGMDTMQRATIAGIKYLIVHNRDAAKHEQELNVVYEAMKAEAVAASNISLLIKQYIIENKDVQATYNIQQEFLNFLNDKRQDPQTDKDELDEISKLLKKQDVRFSYINSENWTSVEQEFSSKIENKLFSAIEFQKVLGVIKSAGEDEIDKIITDRIEPFESLNKAAQVAVEKIRTAPQFSLAFQSKTQKDGPDEYKFEAIYDKGLYRRINFTFNAAFGYKDSKSIGADIRTGTIAGELQFQVTPEKRLSGRNPIYFYVAGEGKWMSGMDSIGKIQTKLKIPIVEGIDFPISFTFATRTELIDEKEVRGQFGFTFDVARLVQALGFR